MLQLMGLAWLQAVVLSLALRTLLANESDSERLRPGYLRTIDIDHSQSWLSRPMKTCRSDGKVYHIRELGIATIFYSTPVQFNSALRCDIILRGKVANKTTLSCQRVTCECKLAITIPFTMYIAIRRACIYLKRDIDRLLRHKCSGDCGGIKVLINRACHLWAGNQ